MDTKMRKRLREVLEADPRSYNKISEDADLGRNYVRSVVKDGQKPGVEALLAILNTLGDEATVYVLTGRQVTQMDLEFLSLVSAMSPETKQSAIALFRDLLGREEA